MDTNDILNALSEERRRRCIDDIISLLRSLDHLYNDFFENLSNDSLENASDLGIRLDTLNRFGHSLMEKITEDDF